MASEERLEESPQVVPALDCVRASHALRREGAGPALPIHNLTLLVAGHAAQHFLIGKDVEGPELRGNAGVVPLASPVFIDEQQSVLPSRPRCPNDREDFRGPES